MFLEDTFMLLDVCGCLSQRLSKYMSFHLRPVGASYCVLGFIGFLYLEVGIEHIPFTDPDMT